MRVKRVITCAAVGVANSAVPGRVVAPVRRPVLRRGLSCHAVDGRLPVDFSGDHALDFPAGTRGVLRLDAANFVTSRRNPRRTSGYAFSTANSADLKLTPHE
jgi:hypothetical protein